MYTRELINEVKEIYPNSHEMHKLAESGSVYLGMYLDDSSTGRVSINTILLATSLDEIQNVARIEKRKVELYSKWCDQDPRQQH